MRTGMNQPEPEHLVSGLVVGNQTLRNIRGNMKELNIGIVTPLALQSLPIEFHLSYIANVNYIQANASKLPFKIKQIRMIAPHTFPIDANRNECIAYIKKWDIDISLWMDADQDFMNTADENKPNVLFNLLKDGYEYPIYAGIYYLKKPPYYPIVFQANEDFDVFSPIWLYEPDELFYADMIGMGCCKIDRSIINQLDHPYFKYNSIPKALATNETARFKFDNHIEDVSEDVAFWKQVKEKTGKRIVVDPRIQVGHVSKFTVTQRVFQSHVDINKEMAQEELGEKFDEYWSKICRAEPVK